MSDLQIRNLRIHRSAAAAVVQTLLASPGSNEIVLDIPAVNREAIALAEQAGLDADIRNGANVHWIGPVTAARPRVRPHQF